MSTHMDVTQTKIELTGAEYERLYNLAYTDGLTGAGNRNLLDEADLGGQRVVLADLDNFKNMNDTNGHRAGDLTLIAFAQFLRDLGMGQVYRLGGDEFVLITDVPGLACAAIRAWEYEFNGVTVTASSGHGPSVEEADVRMYAAKGRPRR